MMSEAVQEKAVCWKCGAEIREGSMFCYGCGADLSKPESIDGAGPVAELVQEELVEQEEEAIQEEFTEEEVGPVQEELTEKELEVLFEPQMSPIPKPDVDIEGKHTYVKPESSNVMPGGVMRTAAHINKNRKRKPPEKPIYVWAETTDANIYFSIAFLILLILGIGLIVLGLYIR